MERIYYTRRIRNPQRHRPRVILFYIILFIGVFLSTYFLVTNQISKRTFLLNPLAQKEAIPVIDNPLASTVANELNGTKGSYAVLVKNLKTNKEYAFNAHRPYYSASLYKLWVMATAYQQIQKGTLNPDEIIEEDVKDLNDTFNIASESAELTEGTIKLSVTDALTKMITISDNYAALLLTKKVRLSNIAAFLKQNDFTESSLGTTAQGAPQTTAYDIALFFEKLYRGQLINKEYSKKMLTLLKAQRLNDKIPRDLPDTIIVAHKTGELDEYTHDAGIIFAPNDDYILVILSKSNAPDLAKDRIANISHAVYIYWTNEK